MTHFNKRHYQDIARAIQEARFHILATEWNADFGPAEAINAVISELAGMFAADNRLFKRDLFLQACQPGANVRARKVA